MNTTAKLEISVLITAFAVGVLGDTLLRCFPWGVNFALWGVLLAAAVLYLGRARPQTFAGGGAWLLLPIALAPLTFLWRDSTVLKSLSIFSLVVALSLAMLRARGGRLQTSSLIRYALGSLFTFFNAAFGMLPLVFTKREWNKSAGWSELRKVVAVLLGVALAIPPLLLFGALFMGADAVFKTFAMRFLRAIPSHILLTAFIAYIAGGYLRGVLFGKELSLPAGPRSLPISLGAIEMGVMLGLLDALFLAFVVVQVRYFFGGSAQVHATTGLTFADYARRGFFELLAVAALLLPFLLAVHWLLRTDDTTGQRLFRWLAGFQIALLFVIMASAVQRMRLYQEQYGLSEQRLYPTAFMGWLAVVFVWFCLTVLRGQRERFTFGAMVAGFLLVAALEVINPDALIARTNMERAREGHIFDASYLLDLSADAVPEIVAGLPTLNRLDRRTLSKGMLDQWSRPQDFDWRSWSIARSRAWRAVSENESSLRHPDVRVSEVR